MADQATTGSGTGAAPAPGLTHLPSHRIAELRLMVSRATSHILRVARAGARAAWTGARFTAINVVFPAATAVARWSDRRTAPYIPNAVHRRLALGGVALAVTIAILAALSASLGRVTAEPLASAASDKSIALATPSWTPMSRSTADGGVEWDVGNGITLTFPTPVPAQTVGRGLLIPLRQGSQPGVCAILFVSCPAGAEIRAVDHAMAEVFQQAFDAEADVPAQSFGRGPFIINAKDLGGDFTVMHGYASAGQTDPGSATGPRLYFWARGDVQAVAGVIGVAQRSMSVAPSGR